MPNPEPALSLTSNWLFKNHIAIVLGCQPQPVSWRPCSQQWQQVLADAALAGQATWEAGVQFLAHPENVSSVVLATCEAYEGGCDILRLCLKQTNKKVLPSLKSHLENCLFSGAFPDCPILLFISSPTRKVGVSIPRAQVGRLARKSLALDSMLINCRPVLQSPSSPRLHFPRIRYCLGQTVG